MPADAAPRWELEAFDPADPDNYPDHPEHDDEPADALEVAEAPSDFRDPSEHGLGADG